jgi:hypothetical protein
MTHTWVRWAAGCDQAEGPVEAALAASIGTVHHGEASQRKGELLQGAVAGHGQMAQTVSGW